MGSNIRIRRGSKKGQAITAEKVVMDKRPEGAKCARWQKCQQLAISECRGELAKDGREKWHDLSTKCGKVDCCFNLVGREERSLEDARIARAEAHRLEVEELQRMSRDWVDAQS